MSPRLLQLDAPTLHALKERVLAEHGPNARVIAAEKVTVGGIRGFFARHHYEATVEVDDEPEQDDSGQGEPGIAAHVVFDLPARVGIAALLDEADGEEAAFHGVQPPAVISTQAADFAAIMDNLTFNTAPEASTGTAVPPAPAVPAPSRSAGDLIVVAGPAESALRVAGQIASAIGRAGLHRAGTLAQDGQESVSDRRTAMAARARGVELEQTVVVAFGIEAGVGVARTIVTALDRVDADQLWLVVDAGRKVDDTARWVTAIAAVTPVHALAVEGRATTATPATINELAIPVGWVDGEPARLPRL